MRLAITMKLLDDDHDTDDDDENDDDNEIRNNNKVFRTLLSVVIKMLGPCVLVYPNNMAAAR